MSKQLILTDRFMIVLTLQTEKLAKRKDDYFRVLAAHQAAPTKSGDIVLPLLARKLSKQTETVERLVMALGKHHGIELAA